MCQRDLSLQSLSTTHLTGLLCTAALSLPSWAEIKDHKEPYISYTIAAGDTLEQLSKTLLSDPKRWDQLAKLNGVSNPHLLTIGRVIDVPRSMINFKALPQLTAHGVLEQVNGKVLIDGQPAQAGARVSEGAKIETAEGSSATVKLAEGSSVQIMPRSLAQVTTQHGYALKDPASSQSTTWYSGAIRLIAGALDIGANKLAQRKDPLTVTTNTSVIGVRGTQFRVSYENPATGLATTEVLEGKVRSDSVTQKVGTEVGGGFGVAIKPQDTRVVPIALLPALALSALPIVVNRNQNQEALWGVSTLPDAVSYRVELAKDADFSQIILGTQSVQPQIDLGQVADGKYFARVRGVDAQGVQGFNASRQIEIRPPLALRSEDEIATWGKRAHIAAFAEQTAGGLFVQLRLQELNLPRQLQAWVATDAQLSQNLSKLRVNEQGQFVIPQTQSGQTYYIQLHGRSEQGNVHASPVLFLNVPLSWGSTVSVLSDALRPLD